MKNQSTPDMDTTQRNVIMQRWRVLQRELLPELRHEVGALTTKLSISALFLPANSMRFYRPR